MRHKNFPPYEMADRELVSQAEDRTRKLARIYHVATDQAWDGKKVLDELCAKHGGIHFPADKKPAMARIGSVLLWGELAAWSISADLALRLHEVEPKMAATSQVFDEARHFTVLREYLWRAGIQPAPLSGGTRAVLLAVLNTDHLLHKLVGMQLLVEVAAMGLFKAIASAELEPVLTDVLYYFERDEARHVGLGALLLPRLLPELSEIEAARLWWFQLRIQLNMLAGMLSMREAFSDLAIDPATLNMHTFRLHKELCERILTADGQAPRAERIRGLFLGSRKAQERLNGLFFPNQPRNEWPAWQRTTIDVIDALTRRAGR